MINIIFIWITCQLNILRIFLPVIPCMALVPISSPMKFHCVSDLVFQPFSPGHCYCKQWHQSWTPSSSEHSHHWLAALLSAPITNYKNQLAPSSYGKAYFSAWNGIWIPGLSPVPSTAARINKEEKNTPYQSDLKMSPQILLLPDYKLGTEILHL